MKNYFKPLVISLFIFTNGAAQASTLSTTLQDIRFLFQARISESNCVTLTQSYYKKLFDSTFADNQTEISRSAEKIVNDSFDLRLLIKEKTKQLQAESCIASIRDLIRSLRYMEDYIIESHYSGFQAESFDVLDGDGIYHLKNKKFNYKNYKDLQAGDIILSRGNAFTSSAISRIGTVDTQFSHISFVYKDQNGHLHTTESHIEIGVVNDTMQVHRDGGNAREVVLRFNDSAKAKEAATYVWNKVAAYKKQTKRNINYDFGMDYKDDSELFCSEVASVGFANLSSGSINIPEHKTKFNFKLAKFLNKIGVQINESNKDSFDTFSPGDIELDSRFEIVAEWRNPAKLLGLRHKDAILTKMFEWIENDDYEFDISWKVSAQSYLGYILRRIPFVKKKFVKKFPLNMKPTQMSVFVMLDMIGENMEELLQQNLSAQTLSFKEMFKILEDYRQKDLALYNNGSKNAFLHRYLRSAK